MVLATRGRLQWLTGDDAEPAYAGGAGELPGFSRRAVTGTRLALGNAELRFPVVKSLILSLPGGGLRLPDIMGALFVEAASAGYGEWEDPLGGVGASLYMGGGYLPALRVDFLKQYEGGWQPDLTTQFNVGFNF